MVYPDPASNELNVALAIGTVHDLQLEVMDMAGRIVLRPSVMPEAQGPQRIDVQHLAEGHYVLRLTWDGGRDERRFSVVR
jgi:hypothetical protein